jgi:putative CocE/NonD family hydrolase
MTQSIRIDIDVELTARDGTVLRADVYRPAQDAKVPAILLRTPYDKSSMRVATAVLGSVRPVNAAMNGFAFVVQDIRGRFRSEGEYSPSAAATEGMDGYDAIEWLASEPWCTGRVATIGGSYSSIVQWLAAEQRPPSLRAMVPERSGGTSTGMLGAMQLDSTMIGWAAMQAIDHVRKEIAAGRATASDLAPILAAFEQPQSAARHLPLDDHPLFARTAGLPSFAERVDMFIRSTADLQVAHIEVPVLTTCGWYDLDPGGASDLFRRVRSSAGTPQARDGSRVVFGPWEHTIQTSYTGERFFGNHASADGFDLPGRTLRFLSKWLRDDDTDIPVASYFVMGCNEWRDAAEWPPPGTSERELFLSSGGGANGEGGDGSLVWDPVAAEPPDRFDYDPLDPVPSFGGRYLDIGGSLPGPYDQRRVEQRADVLVYTSVAMVEPLEIAGEAALRLHVASSAVDTDFVAKLCDVDPSGLSHNIADGFFRCRWRNGADGAARLTPGQIEEHVVDLGAVAHAFLPGHRIRLQVTSSAFPAWDRNMNTGHPLGSDAAGIVATQTVHHGGTHPSALLLPIPPGPRAL